jgi:hypothetical protein
MKLIITLTSIFLCLVQSELIAQRSSIEAGVHPGYCDVRKIDILTGLFEEKYTSKFYYSQIPIFITANININNTGEIAFTVINQSSVCIKKYPGNNNFLFSSIARTSTEKINTTGLETTYSFYLDKNNEFAKFSIGAHAALFHNKMEIKHTDIPILDKQIDSTTVLILPTVYFQSRIIRIHHLQLNTHLGFGIKSFIGLSMSWILNKQNYNDTNVGYRIIK